MFDTGLLPPPSDDDFLVIKGNTLTAIVSPFYELYEWAVVDLGSQKDYCAHHAPTLECAEFCVRLALWHFDSPFFFTYS